MGVVNGESVEEDFRRAVGDIVTIFIGNENELRGAGRKDSAVTDFKSRDEVEIVGEDFVSFEGAVVVFVFEYDEPVLSFAFFLSAGISEGFGNPDAAAAIEGEGDGLTKERLAGDRFNLESFGNEDIGCDIVFFSAWVWFEVPEEWAGAQASG